MFKFLASVTITGSIYHSLHFACCILDLFWVQNEAFDLEQCGNELNRVLDNYSSENIQLLQSEVEKITSLASRVDMKRIGNFQSRLEELNSKMKQSEKLTQRQSFILDVSSQSGLLCFLVGAFLEKRVNYSYGFSSVFFFRYT